MFSVKAVELMLEEEVYKRPHFFISVIMAYVTRPALLPADYGYSNPSTTKSSPKPAKKPKTGKKKTVTKVKTVVKKTPVKRKSTTKKGRSLPWKV